MKKCFVSQRSVNDCAVACLTTILKLYGKQVSYEDVKKNLKVDKEGSTAYDIIKTAKKYNLYANGYKNYELNDNSNFPLIVHTIHDEIQHFVVVLSVNKHLVTVYDPASGKKMIKKEEFNKVYTGIAITFEDINLSYKFLFRNKKSIINITFLVLFLSIFNILYSYLLSYVMQSKLKSIGKFMILLLVLAVLKEFFNVVKNNYLLKYRVDSDLAITIPTLKKVLFLPLESYQKSNSGELISKINDLSYVKEMYFAVNEILFVNIIIIFLSLICIYFISFSVFLLVILIISLLIILNKFFYNKYAYKNYNLQVDNEILTKNISDSLDRISLISNLCKQKYFANKITSKYKGFINEYKKVSNLYIIKDFISKIISIILTLLSIFIIYNGNETNILFVIYLESMILDSMFNICILEETYANYKSSYKRLSLFYKSKTNFLSPNKIDIKSMLFNNISLKRGDSLFVEGKTGSGKTTFFKKLVNNYMNFKINGASSTYYDAHDIKRSILYVDQKAKLFNTSIKDNITLGDNLKLRDNTYKIISNILYKGGKDETYIINNQQDNISAGEAKLILIAQALNSDSDVIIFDETTNELDEDAEKKLFEVILKEYQDKIIILISHRHSNKSLFNKYISFSSGKILNYERSLDEKFKYKRIKTHKSRSYKRLANSWNNSRSNLRSRNI